MKSLFLKFLFLFTFICFASISPAQDKIKVSESSEHIEGVKGNALKVNIYRADEKTVAKEWRSELKSNSGDVDIKGSSIIAKDVLIKSISNHEITVYAAIKRIDETTIEFAAIFLNGDRAISSSDAGAHVVTKKMIQDFANSVSKEAAKEHHEEQLKQLKDLNKSLEDITEEIEEANELILLKQQEIEENTTKKEELLLQIEEQGKTVETAENEIGFY